jgi:Tfp pilus assembly protein PilF
VNEKRFDVKIKQSLFVLLVGSAFFFFFSTSTAFAKSVTFQKEYTYRASEADSKLAYVNRGIAYMEKGQHDLAIRDFSKTIEIDPSYIEAYLNRGITYLVQGQYDLAIRDYTRALEIDPRNANTYVHRCLAYSSLGLDEQAIKDYRTAARLGDAEAQSFLTSEGIGW